MIINAFTNTHYINSLVCGQIYSKSLSNGISNWCIKFECFNLVSYIYGSDQLDRIDFSFLGFLPSLERITRHQTTIFYCFVVAKIYNMVFLFVILLLLIFLLIIACNYPFDWFQLKKNIDS